MVFNLGGIAIITTLGRRLGDRSVMISAQVDAAAHLLVCYPLVAFYDIHGRRWREGLIFIQFGT